MADLSPTWNLTNSHLLILIYTWSHSKGLPSMKCQNWCKTTFEKRGSILVSCEVSRKRIHLRDRQYQRNVTQERNLPLKLLKCLTDLISALCSMATTSCSKDQALANLNLDKAIIYHLCRGFQKRPSHREILTYGRFNILTFLPYQGCRRRVQCFQEYLRWHKNLLAQR